MATTKVRLRIPGFVAVRSAPALIALQNRLAADIAARAGAGFAVSGSRLNGGGPKARARALVLPTTPQARAAEARNRALTRAVRG